MRRADCYIALNRFVEASTDIVRLVELYPEDEALKQKQERTVTQALQSRSSLDGRLE